MAAGSSDKTEQPTPKRLKDAKRDGNVARSPDITAWLGILGMSVLMQLTISRTYDAAAATMLSVRSITADPDPGQALALLGEGLKLAALAVLPLFAALMLIAVIGGAAQGGAMPVPKRLKPKFSKLNPWNGLKRAFGPQGGWEMIKALLKSTLVGILVYRAVVDITPVVMGSGALPVRAVVMTIGTTAVSLVRNVAAAALVLAAVDYFVSWRRIRKQVRMTRKEVTDENKQAEGDPQVKASLRQRAQALSRNRMMADVPQADVVILNPTHIAVALKYSPGKGAPRVVAKGAGVVAARIRALASENRVPMVEDKPLARALHKTCDIGQEVPRDLYTAVARILAFVMALKKRGTAAGVHTSASMARSAALAARQPVRA